MNKSTLLLMIVGTIWLSACVSPLPAPTLAGEDKTAESQNAWGISTAEGGTPAPTLPPDVTVAPTGTLVTEIQATLAEGLKPADSDSPAAGICTEPPTGDTVTMTIRTDVPDPRCAKARPDQRLVLVNATALPIKAKLGDFNVPIHPGAEKQLDKPLGEYLAPGVHFIEVTMPGMGGELWLVDE